MGSECGSGGGKDVKLALFDQVVGVLDEEDARCRLPHAPTIPLDLEVGVEAQKSGPVERAQVPTPAVGGFDGAHAGRRDANDDLGLIASVAKGCHQRVEGCVCHAARVAIDSYVGRTTI